MTSVSSALAFLVVGAFAAVLAVLAARQASARAGMTKEQRNIEDREVREELQRW